MPVKHAIWTVGDSPNSLPVSKLATEQLLEEMIVKDPRILSDQWLLIGRQEVTTGGGRLDLLGIAPDGSLVLIELKREKTPREIVAQALDYASWVEKLTAEKIAQIYQRFDSSKTLDDAFKGHFGMELDEDTLNESHQIILCAAQLDAATERIVEYLNDKDIPINVLFFQVFDHSGSQLLSRSWLIDPGETQENAANRSSRKGASEPWNGEFYGSFGASKSRSWAEARQYGFFSAGGGSWYTQTLSMLNPGDRIWARIPKEGFVGVGIVEETAQPANSYKIETPEGMRPCLEVLKKGDYHRDNVDDPELSEHFVKVRWLDSLPREKAFHESGMLGQQNSVCKPTTPKWRHTVERLKGIFKNWDSA